MKLNKIISKFFSRKSFEKIKPDDKNESKLQINEFDENSEVLKINQIGITPFGQGALILKTNNGIEFPISAFSPETAKSISDFQKGKRNEIPSIYNMLEQICEASGLLLVKVRIYASGDVLRANLYFTGKNELILRNYRASDAIALAVFYNIPILIKKSLLEQSSKMKTK
ncbi:MAG: bifunctional nuclease family protein [Nitrosopumilaceae archaeon]